MITICMHLAVLCVLFNSNLAAQSLFTLRNGIVILCWSAALAATLVRETISYDYKVSGLMFGCEWGGLPAVPVTVLLATASLLLLIIHMVQVRDRTRWILCLSVLLALLDSVNVLLLCR